jgi:hypothetical protein
MGDRQFKVRDIGGFSMEDVRYKQRFENFKTFI